MSSSGPAMQVRRLVEQDRLGRDRLRRLSLRVVGVVEADGDEIADIADAGAQPRLAGHERKALGIQGREALHLRRGQGRGGDVGDLGREIANAPRAVEKPRLLRA